MNKIITSIICGSLFAFSTFAEQSTANNLKLLSVQTKNIKSRSARINIILNQHAQTQIEYGDTAQYGKFSQKEPSFKYKNHNMKIIDLKPLTRYHYRVHAWDRQGKEVISGDYSFTTTKLSPPHKWASNWGHDYQTALLEAKQQHKPVFVLFTGSDWCPPCMRLEKTILNTKEFQDYLAKNYLLLLIEFPHHRELNSTQRKHNRKILKIYKINGVPTILILDAKGKIIGKTGTAKESKTLIAQIAASRASYEQKLKR